MKNENLSAQKIIPYLWMNGQVEEALNFYTGIFNTARIISVRRYGDGWPGTEGQIMTAVFELEGIQFMMLDGGPHYTFSPAISFLIECSTQNEVDHLWERLSEGGEALRCGWLKDKYGISWQVVPKILGTLMHDSDPVRSRNVLKALLCMNKIDISVLQHAYSGDTK